MAEGQQIQALLITARSKAIDTPSPFLLCEIWIWSVWALRSLSALKGYYSRVTFTRHCARLDLSIWLLGKGFHVSWAINLWEIKMVGSGTPGRTTSLCGMNGINCIPSSRQWALTSLANYCNLPFPHYRASLFHMVATRCMLRFTFKL